MEKSLLLLLQKAEVKRKYYRFFKLFYFFQIQIILLIFVTIAFAPLLLDGSRLGETFQVHNLERYLVPHKLYWIIFFVSMFASMYFKVRYTQLEKEVVQTIVRKIDKRLKFENDNSISLQEIADSEIILPPGKGKKHSNHIENPPQSILMGRIGHTTIRIGSIDLFHQRSRTTLLLVLPIINIIAILVIYLRPWFTSKTVDHVGKNFTGMLAVANFNKKIHGVIVVLPDKLEKRIGYLAKSIQSLNLKNRLLIHLENTEFEKEFVVYGTDQIEARYILSTAIMDRIVALKKKMGRPIMLSFKNDKLYIAIEHPYGFFNLPENKNLVHSNALELFHENIACAIGIVKDLDLNTRIWRKSNETIFP
ncbi:DUF3137 domain-containing protein [Flagellimonas amoyensis]|uniref:DUF3137 domain-containing protein n=1 Tax=Flagellimonas amoyensis TaxID=2169401 RepID=UPI000D38AD06|nr:DUF3137 domain-containing protein [Allomuricauda amoyensis]